MLDFFFAMIAAGANGSAGEAPDVAAVADPPAATVILPQDDGTATVTIGQGSVVIGENVVIEGKPAATPAPAPTPAQVSAPNLFNMAVVPAGLQAEPQTPSGKFTTATEVRPILDATRGSWVAVREYDGKDWLYVTHLWGWRCGLAAMAISINDEPMQNWPLPPCHMKYTTPNAILEDDGIPALTLKLGGVQKITIQIVYDDLSMDMAEFERANVLIP
ncbi:hypothetical protein [Sulfitobacter sp. JB4-11]|uniref:hypothetical protein n=1 Tax=Sulfitobacter rhodophyticola TaxID=3238304 RepID=UPI003518005E